MSANRPSLLAVTSQLPWPLNTGGHLRTFHMMRCLAKRFRVRLVAGAAANHDEGRAALEREGVALRPVILGQRRAWREGLRALGAAVRGEPYVLYERHNRAEVRAALAAEMRAEPPDLLYLDHLDSAVFAGPGSTVPVGVDLHNVYSLLVQREAEDRGGLTGMYLKREARLLAKAEQRAARLAEVVFAVSDVEADHYRSLGARSVHVVPNGVDCAAYESLPAGRGDGPPVILYVGTMSWSPNASAVRFLAAEVLPRVRERVPAAELWVVGKDPPPDLAATTQAGVRVLGGVPSMLAPLQAAHVLAVPLEAGGGTRLKILEAFAAGLPVVSTPVGCEGIRFTAGQHLLVRERGQFAEALVGLLADPAAGARLAEHARQLARDLYDWDAVGRAAADALEAALRQPVPCRSPA
jgi:glycosyltransferase involved in cell wall biosynthesis